MRTGTGKLAKSVLNASEQLTLTDASTDGQSFEFDPVPAQKTTVLKRRAIELRTSGRTPQLQSKIYVL